MITSQFVCWWTFGVVSAFWWLRIKQLCPFWYISLANTPPSGITRRQGGLHLHDSIRLPSSQAIPGPTPRHNGLLSERENPSASAPREGARWTQRSAPPPGDAGLVLTSHWPSGLQSMLGNVVFCRRQRSPAKNQGDFYANIDRGDPYLFPL